MDLINPNISILYEDMRSVLNVQVGIPNKINCCKSCVPFLGIGLSYPLQRSYDIEMFVRDSGRNYLYTPEYLKFKEGDLNYMLSAGISAVFDNFEIELRYDISRFITDPIVLQFDSIVDMVALGSTDTRGAWFLSFSVRTNIFIF